MSVEDPITTALHESLDRLDVTPGDPQGALSSGSSLRHRRTASRVVAVVAVVTAVAAVGVVVSGGDDGLEPAPPPCGARGGGRYAHIFLPDEPATVFAIAARLS